jgi:Xaa-Pro aminopeptidase
MHLYQGSLPEVLQTALGRPRLVPADALLGRLRAVKTPHEVACIRQACGITAEAFRAGSRQLHGGLTEVEAAAAFTAPLSSAGVGREGIERAGGHVACMSGPNAAEAFGAYARSRTRQLRPDDLVLVHCNSYADGYWTDVTRTYCLREPDGRKRGLYQAVLAARAAALAVIRPGARAADVDRAARDVLAAAGLGAAFKHPTGHGVGFAAIDHNARPRLHPRSDETLGEGMVFNVEPAAYLEGYGGLRHCDVVAVTATGVEVLTPFQASLEELYFARSEMRHH